MTDQKQLDNAEYFNYLGSMIRNDARCKSEIKSRITKGKTAFIKKTFQQQIGLKFKEATIEVIHSEHSVVWRWKQDTLKSRSEIGGKF